MILFTVLLRTQLCTPLLCRSHPSKMASKYKGLIAIRSLYCNSINT